MPADSKKIAEDESKRLAQLHPTSSEYHVVKNYLEWLLAMPWSKSTKDQLDIPLAKTVLSEDHYGMDTIKKRILEFLAVAKLKNTLKGSIICLVGPPGVGKTSLGRSIAKAVNRKFARISLGGVRDESEIRGHRRTYVGAMPGKLIQTMKRIGVNNPVILLDEIDKLARSNQGDPGAALLEVLDPEQNVAFQDHYLDTPFDLSNTLFIATANSLEDIPAPLRDRMEIIMLGSYTLSEKKYIALNHLVPKQLQDHALTPTQVKFSEEAVELVISGYTKEAGVRELQRKIAALCRASAQEIIENNAATIKLTLDKVEEYLGTVIFKHEEKLSEDEVAVATGLAWTPFGGDVLFIEANKSEGSGKIILTGSLGNVMKESAQIAVSYLRSNKDKYKITTNFDTLDLHIHLPSGAVPKDGPSAGITLATTILSLLTDKKISKNIAMTGELSLRGRVMPVGGIKEKLVAAYKAGIQEVLLPRENESDLKELPEEVRKGLKIHLVDNIDQVFTKVLNS
jgi:ATP-dependent Lon protease